MIFCLISQNQKKVPQLPLLLKPRSHCPGVRPGASRQFVAGGPGRTWTNREGIRVRSYIPGSATDNTRSGAKSDHGLSRLCYGLRRFIPGVAPGELRCVPVRPDTPRLYSGHRRGRPRCHYGESRKKDGKAPV